MASGKHRRIRQRPPLTTRPRGFARPQMPKLTLVDLSFNDLGVTAALALADALRARGSITRLNVEANRLSGTWREFGVAVGVHNDSGVRAIAACLEQPGCRLAVLNLSHNGIDAAGAKAIGHAVAVAAGSSAGSALTKLHVGSSEHALP
eukprot:7383265-Prymnesium_polylepis.1